MSRLLYAALSSMALLVVGIFGVTYLYTTSITYFVVASAVYLIGAVIAAFAFPLLFENHKN
jgi:hypothetical protein